MKKNTSQLVVKCLSFALILLILPFSTAYGANIRHLYSGDGVNGDPLNSFYLDERGGSPESNDEGLTYFMTHQEINQHGLGGGLLLFVEDNGGGLSVEEGFPGNDFTPGSNIQIFPLPNLPLTSAPGEIGLASFAPITPVFYTGNDSGLLIEQVSFTSYAPDAEFVGIEYSVVNTTDAPVSVSLGVSHDFDAGLESDDDHAGVVGIPEVAGVIPMVYVVEVPPYAPEVFMVGASLAGSDGASAIYRLESCPGAYGLCAIFGEDGDVVRTAFFEEPAAQGNLTTGPAEDYAVSLATAPESIPPGGRLTTVFCHPIGSGADEALALADLQAQAEACRDFYEDEIQNCGNYLINLGEACDDGNLVDTDACLNTCELASCGDDFIWAGVEECDDGDANSNSGACLSTCELATCGDGFVQEGVEECDEGEANSDSGACLDSCVEASCGDGFIHAGVEVCDTGIPGYGADCQSNCTIFNTCGNGAVDHALEQCDDGNSNNGDACPNNCQNASCGDGYVRSGVEQCDDGNNLPGDGCSPACLIEPGFSEGDPVGTSDPVCGDGNVDEEIGETCDDGNTEDLDGCSSQCLFEPVIQGSGTPSGEGGGGCSLSLAGSSASFAQIPWLLMMGLLLAWRQRKSSLFR